MSCHHLIMLYPCSCKVQVSYCIANNDKLSAIKLVDDERYKGAASVYTSFV